MIINDLYKKLDKIFVDYTTHQWKNGWQHEGDRLSKELTIQKDIPWCNMFLLQQTSKYIYGNGLTLDGPQGFSIEVEQQHPDKIRIDIESNIGNINIYYYVDNESDWLSTVDFIVDMCQKVYDSNVKFRESISAVPKGIYGEINPTFTKSSRRQNQLNDLGI